MTNLTEEQLRIEEIRRRAKDSKAEAASQFSKLSESYLDKTRNYTFLIDLGVVGYLGSTQQHINSCMLGMSIASFVFGLISIFFSYLYALANANFYAELEKNLAAAFPEEKVYLDMLRKEERIREVYKNRHANQILVVVFLALQVLATLTLIHLSLSK